MNNSLCNDVTFVLPYDLSIILSYLTRLNNSNSSLEDSLGVESMLNELVTLLESSEVTLSIHNDSLHISQILRQVEFLLRLVDDHIAWDRLNWELWKRIKFLLGGYKKRLNSIPISSTREFYLTSRKIEDIFQSPWMFQSWAAIIKTELIKWWQKKVHPNTDSLAETLDIEKIKRLMKFAVEELFWSKMPQINYHDAKNSWVHKLLWNQNSSWTNYIVAPYRIADYLSFEFPHNATHLVHLSRLDKNVNAYFDSMSQRSFFEWLAVLSEYFEYDQFGKNRELWNDLHDILWLNPKWISKQQLRDFLIADRIFEFRLRAVRLMGDLLVMEWYSLEEIIRETASAFWFDEEITKSEITKYYSHTGLWGIYTFGYLRLLQSKIINPMDVIGSDSVPRRWSDLK